VVAPRPAARPHGVGRRLAARPSLPAAAPDVQFVVPGSFIPATPKFTVPPEKINRIMRGFTIWGYPVFWYCVLTNSSGLTGVTIRSRPERPAKAWAFCAFTGVPLAPACYYPPFQVRQKVGNAPAGSAFPPRDPASNILGIFGKCRRIRKITSLLAGTFVETGKWRSK